MKDLIDALTQPSHTTDWNGSNIPTQPTSPTALGTGASHTSGTHNAMICDGLVPEMSNMSIATMVDPPPESESSTTTITALSPPRYRTIHERIRDLQETQLLHTGYRPQNSIRVMCLPPIPALAGYYLRSTNLSATRTTRHSPIQSWTIPIKAVAPAVACALPGDKVPRTLVSSRSITAQYEQAAAVANAPRKYHWWRQPIRSIEEWQVKSDAELLCMAIRFTEKAVVACRAVTEQQALFHGVALSPSTNPKPCSNKSKPKTNKAVTK